MQHKIVFISGASSGIGAATATRFAKAGANIILCGRRLKRLNDLATTLQKSYAIETHCLAFDVSKANEVNQALNSLPIVWRNIDILVNNAGLSLSWTQLPEGDINDWDQVIDTNIKGVLYLIKAILPTMIDKNDGHIVNLGSIAGQLAYPYGNVYCATKFAIKGLTDGLRADLLGKNIRVTLISPGIVETEFSTVRFKGDEQRAKAVYANIKSLSPNDVADAIFYATSIPAHINISEITLMPTAQVNPLLVHRDN